MAGWYPVMLNVSGKLCVVFGGGAVAERKIAGLLDAGARVRVVSPTLAPSLDKLASEGRVEWRRKLAEAKDCEGAVLVFAATDQPKVNRQMAAAARQFGIPANEADDGENSDFLVPAVLRRGDLVLAASASGAGPALSARIIRELADRYGPEYAEYAAALRGIRAAAKAQAADPEERRKLLAEAAKEDFLRDWLNAGQPGEFRLALEQLRARIRSGQEERV